MLRCCKFRVGNRGAAKSWGFRAALPLKTKEICTTHAPVEVAGVFNCAYKEVAVGIDVSDGARACDSGNFQKP